MVVYYRYSRHLTQAFWRFQMRRFPLFLVLTIFLCASISILGQNAQIADKKVEVAGVTKSRILEPGANLVIQNLPPVPLELVESVKKYTEFKGVSASNWHPIKREILVGKRAGNATQVHLLSAPMGELK